MELAEAGEEIFCDSAQSWVSLGGDRQRFARGPRDAR
jgi:hypothetical protein